MTRCRACWRWQVLAAGPADRQRRFGPEDQLYSDYTPKSEDPAGKRKGRECRRHQPIKPAKPTQPPPSNSQNGLSRVVAARRAATAVTRAAVQVRSEVNARIRLLAPINPIESGTRDAWIIAGQRDWLDRVKRRLTP